MGVVPIEVNYNFFKNHKGGFYEEQYRDQNRDTKGSQASPNRNLGKETSQQNGSKSYEQKNLEKQAHNQNGSNKHFEQKNHSQTNQNLDIENGQSNYEKNTYRNNK